MLYVEMKRSFARASAKPPSTPVPPSGHWSVYGEIWGDLGRDGEMQRSGGPRVRLGGAPDEEGGGAGHMRSVSAITFCTSGMRLMSSTVA